MRVSLRANQHFEVFFQHFNPKTDGLSRHQKKKLRRGTRCTIYEVSGNAPVSLFADVEIKCSVDDNFCYRTGRKEALKAALRQTNFTKEVKKEFWDQLGFPHTPNKRAWLRTFREALAKIVTEQASTSAARPGPQE